MPAELETPNVIFTQRVGKKVSVYNESSGSSMKNGASVKVLKGVQNKNS